LPDESASNAGDISEEPHYRHPPSTTERSQNSHLSSAISCSSLVSASACDARCFVADALFEMPDDHFVRAGDLAAGGNICTASGETVEVETVTVVPEEVQTLMDLKTQTAVLVVTGTHRVVVQRRSGPQTLQASALRAGDSVLITGGVSEDLIHVESFEARVSVVQLTFIPDRPVEAFHPPPPSILSQGRRWSKTRRGLKKKPDRQKGLPDEISVPDTETSWMYEPPSRAPGV